MTGVLNHQLEISTDRASEASATLTIRNRSRREIARISGIIHGPHCSLARTLPANFSVASQPSASVVQDSINTLITDPCFWTPALPFLYQIDLHVNWTDGAVSHWKQSIGLRRWEVLGSSLFQERRRVVFRGACIDQPSIDQLASAAKAEIAIVSHDLSEELLTTASELGVPLFIDLRQDEDQDAAELSRFSWYPAVAGVLLATKPSDHSKLPNGAKLGSVVRSNDSAEEHALSDMVVVELKQDESPPEWVSNRVKPAFAIRRHEDQIDIADVRTKCDQLQAELAPDFDLAGYFV